MPTFTTERPFSVALAIGSVPMKDGETREQYLRKAANFARATMRRLLAMPEYQHSHKSFALRDALLAAEKQYVDCGTFGVEHIGRGKNSRSPAIEYLNAGDTYATTVLFVRGQFRVGCWGDIVERGNYE